MCVKVTVRNLTDEQLRPPLVYNFARADEAVYTPEGKPTPPISGKITRRMAITQIPTDEIPDHDVLLEGFPCQPLSIAGVSTKNPLGRQHAFLHETQGTVFFDVARIIKAKRPAAFLLENVKNLASHDKGRTFAVILRTLTKSSATRSDTKRSMPRLRAAAPRAHRDRRLPVQPAIRRPNGKRQQSPKNRHSSFPARERNSH